MKIDVLNCSDRENINLSYFKPNFVISSKLPAQLQKLTTGISQKIFSRILINLRILILEMPQTLVLIQLSFLHYL